MTSFDSFNTGPGLIEQQTPDKDTPEKKCESNVFKATTKSGKSIDVEVLQKYPANLAA